MKFAISLCTLVLGTVAWLAPAVPLSAQELEFRLDHFKVYRVGNNKPVDATVALQGQFDEDYRRASVSGPLYFANPVSKNDGEIRDPNAHLNWYRLRGTREPQRTVSVNNQFGKQEFRIGPAVMLAVPAAKTHGGKTFPVSERLDHFKLYQVLDGERVNKRVSLADQFGREKNSAIRPIFFGVPVSKRHGDKTTKIVNEKDHLVVYMLDRRSQNVEFRAKDQFGSYELDVRDAEWLCVPSQKIRFGDVTPPPPPTPKFRLDHFKVYEVESERPVEAKVALNGQFDRGFREAKIAGPVYFANPVSKNGARLIDPNAHLNWYKLAGDEEPKRKVRLVNQFGEQELIIGQPEHLAVPTMKIHDRKSYPVSKRLDHFKTYAVVEGKAIEKEVTLVDQFGDEKNVVLKPIAFGVPVSKQHGDKTTKTVNPKDHLVVYLIKPRRHQVSFETSDQFGKNAQATKNCIWLCVPTAKLAFTELR